MTKDEWYAQLFERLGNSTFRSSFHLKEKDKEYNLFLCQNAKSELNVTSYDPEVSLMTVAKVLESAVYFDDIDKILDGFDDDEEITPRTLIRSLAYKNNQNN